MILARVINANAQLQQATHPNVKKLILDYTLHNGLVPFINTNSTVIESIHPSVVFQRCDLSYPFIFNWQIRSINFTTE